MEINQFKLLIKYFKIIQNFITIYQTNENFNWKKKKINKINNQF